jgi:polyisoprenoid-binding protein YceI
MRRARPILRWWPVLLLAAIAAPAPASDALALDDVRSQAEFEVKLMWLIGLRGEFGAVHGTLTLDRFHGTAQVEARIDTNDLHMRSRSYEAWAKSAEFFDSAHYPQIAFASEPFALQRLTRGGEVEGLLTIRGKARHVRFELEPPVCADPLAGTCPVRAAGSIRRSDFDMRSRRGTLADRVQLRLAVYVRPGAAAG